MINKIKIKNFKSIVDLTLDLGRFNVIIGANGCGKTNILEAITFASAASQDKLDLEYLANRDIRVTDPQFMFNAFDDENNDPKPSQSLITISVTSEHKLNTNVILGYADKIKEWINLADSVETFRIKTAFENYEERTGKTLEILHSEDFDILDLDTKYPEIFNKLKKDK